MPQMRLNQLPQLTLKTCCAWPLPSPALEFAGEQLDKVLKGVTEKLIQNGRYNHLSPNFSCLAMNAQYRGR
jgi:hypothetical protein